MAVRQEWCCYNQQALLLVGHCWIAGIMQIPNQPNQVLHRGIKVFMKVEHEAIGAGF